VSSTCFEHPSVHPQKDLLFFFFYWHYNPLCSRRCHWNFSFT